MCVPDKSCGSIPHDVRGDIIPPKNIDTCRDGDGPSSSDQNIKFGEVVTAAAEGLLIIVIWSQVTVFSQHLQPIAGGKLVLSHRAAPLHYLGPWKKWMEIISKVRTEVISKREKA